MDETLVKPGETVDVRRLDAAHGVGSTLLLVKTDNVQIIHVVVSAGQKLPTHDAWGEIVLHCLEGRISVAALGKTHELAAGQLFYYCLDESFSVQGIEQASLLVTIIMPKVGQGVELIGS